MEISSCNLALIVIPGAILSIALLGFILSRREEIFSSLKDMWKNFVHRKDRTLVYKFTYVVVVLVILGAIFIGVRSIPKPEISVYQCEPQEENTTAFFDCGCGD